jgi:hypothetical protein
MNSCPIRRPVSLGSIDLLHRLVRPQIAAADAGVLDDDEGVGRLDQAGVGDVLDADVRRRRT